MSILAQTTDKSRSNPDPDRATHSLPHRRSNRHQVTAPRIPITAKRTIQPSPTALTGPRLPRQPLSYAPIRRPKNSRRPKASCRTTQLALRQQAGHASRPTTQTDQSNSITTQRAAEAPKPGTPTRPTATGQTKRDPHTPHPHHTRTRTHTHAQRAGPAPLRPRRTFPRRGFRNRLRSELRRDQTAETALAIRARLWQSPHLCPHGNT
jgi:hypothetical protein